MAVGALCSVTELPPLFHLMGEEGMKCCEVLQVGGAGPSQSIAGTAPIFNPE